MIRTGRPPFCHRLWTSRSLPFLNRVVALSGRASASASPTDRTGNPISSRNRRGCPDACRL